MDDFTALSVMEDQFTVMESEALVSGGEDGAIGACGAEPQHIRAIIHSRTGKNVTCQADTVRLVYRQGEPLRQVP